MATKPVQSTTEHEERCRKAARALRIKRVPILRQTRKRPARALEENSTQPGLDAGQRCSDNEAETTKGLLGATCSQLCTAFGIPFTPFLMSSMHAFHDQRLRKLEYLNEQMVHVYASAFIYRHTRGMRKETFVKGIKREMFDKALAEIDGWEGVQEAEDCEVVCNLYSIVGRGESTRRKFA